MQYTKKEKAIKDDGDEHELEPEEGKNTAMIQILIHDELARPLTSSDHTRPMD